MSGFRKSHAMVFVLCFFIFASGFKASFAEIPDTKATANSMNSFALDLYAKIRGLEGNLVFSPFGVYVALAMAYAGARGTTQSQMAKALHLNLPQGKVSEAVAEVASQILSAGKARAVEIRAANGLWAEKSCPFLKEYVESMKVYSNQQGWLSWFSDRAVLRQLDFKHNANSSRKAINKWVQDQTENRIKHLLAPGTVTGLTRLVLTSAVYFNGKSALYFRGCEDEDLTKPGGFYLLSGVPIPVPLMSNRGRFGYWEEPGLQVLEMPYKARDLSMVVLLPPKERPFEEFEQSITPDKLDKLIGSLQLKTVTVFLPRFRLTSEFNLKKPLIELGIKDAFKDADFSGMTGNRDLYISTAIHKACVTPNEEAPEAAAATGVVFPSGKESDEKLQRELVFRADHPFVVLIRHRPTNCILFLARVTDPLSVADWRSK